MRATFGVRTGNAGVAYDSETMATAIVQIVAAAESALQDMKRMQDGVISHE